MTIDNDVRVLHVRVKNFDGEFNSKGGLTVAYSWKKFNSFIEVATAHCSEQDIFIRKVGTRMAIENLNAGKCIKIPFSREQQKWKTPTDIIRGYFSR
jgi:hypothetical protein